MLDGDWSSDVCSSDLLGADIVDGGNGDDIIAGRYGNDVLTGGNGADTFVFQRYDGVDRITDFEAGDKISFEDFARITSFKGMMAYASEIDGDTVIDFGKFGKLTLDDVAITDLTRDQFAF
jgi:Ca2+-binding RTX toxin-like protein